jgi:hypothetical protein
MWDERVRKVGGWGRIVVTTREVWVERERATAGDFVNA